jgi:hypothetical protein
MSRTLRDEAHPDDFVLRLPALDCVLKNQDVLSYQEKWMIGHGFKFENIKTLPYFVLIPSVCGRPSIGFNQFTLLSINCSTCGLSFASCNS